MSDGQPKRRREDYFHERLEDVEDQVDALRLLPERVVGLKDAVEQLRITVRDMAAVEDQRIKDLRADVRELQSAMILAHRRVANGKDPGDGKTDLPLQKTTLSWGSVAKVVTIFAAVFGPTAAVVAALIQALTS